MGSDLGGARAKVLKKKQKEQAAFARVKRAVNFEFSRRLLCAGFLMCASNELTVGTTMQRERVGVWSTEEDEILKRLAAAVLRPGVF